MRLYGIYLSIFFLLTLVGNFYQILVVAPDQVDTKAFINALMTSQGFWLDLLWFLAALLLVHLSWLLCLWVATAGWLKKLFIKKKERILLQVFAFLVSALFLLVLSNRLYPNMQISGFLKFSTVLVSDYFYYGLIVVITASTIASLYFLMRTQQKYVVVLIALASALVVSVVYGSNFSDRRSAINSHNKPNILIIGIDSLRPDETGFFGSRGGLTPNVDKFLAKAEVYSNTYTPYARTFPAWMSILTGLEPVNHGGRFNLINHKHLNKKIAVGHQLQKEGYRTIFSFDERRFNSMDETFGYDAIVGPKHAAWSFVASGYDHPLVNVLCNTFVGKYLFPGIYLNRGRHGNYDPEKYNQAILDEIKHADDQPVFLTAHFLLPHWPWTSRENEELENFESPKVLMLDSLYRYRMMLKQVDRQFGAFMDGLEKSGVLDNTYVFLLSDHGDGFALEKDNLEQGVDSNAELETNTRGHATNVFNLGQYRVLMAARHYGGEDFSPKIKPELSSLMDIYPTIMDILGSSDHGAKLDGISMFSEQRSDRHLFLETGFSILEVTDKEIDIKDVIQNGINAYTVDKQGRLVVKDEYYDLILSAKHRAIMDGDWMLAMVPSMARYPVLVNTAQKKWWPADLYEGAHNWKSMLSSLCDHYNSEPGFDQANLCSPVSRGNSVSYN